jgi:peptidoglycan/xylan/chitin deacetylase (PgdA/CDA1 family)
MRIAYGSSAGNIPNRLRSFLRRAAATLLAYGFRLSGRRRGLALVYHALAEQQGDPARELVPAHAVALFEAQVRHLEARYRVVPAHDLLPAVAARRRGGRLPVSITFDDDLASHLEHAAPALERLGLPATFFLTGASLDAPFAFWWQRLQAAADRGLDIGATGIHERAAAIEAMPFEERARVAEALPADLGEHALNREGVRTLAGSGFEIGFHTLRHDRLPDLDDAALDRALRDGRAELEAVAGPVTTIAYPHGKADARVARAARTAGFDVGFTGRYEPATDGTDPYLVGRVEPSFGTVADFAVQLAGALRRAPQR